LHLGFIHGGTVLTALAMVYSIAASLAVRSPIREVAGSGGNKPPITVLKPLYGAEPETYTCLRSFCDQNYPSFQIVFGVAEASDPVVPVIERLQREFPTVDIQLAIDRRQHGSNRKVSNLINMMPLVRHDNLVIADSDVWVPTDYLANLIAPLTDSGVGVVTCTYRGRPRRGLWAALGAMFINDWFLPSVRVAASAGSRSFAFGATIAIRREVLSSVGGFKAVKDHLADDYRLGDLTRRAGLRTVLSRMVVDTVVTETTFKQLARHELRWLRTIRAVNPLGYCFSAVTFGFPIAAIGCVLAEGSPATLGMLAAITAARWLLYVRTRRLDGPTWHVLLLPLRDAMSLALWACSFRTRRVQWRDSHFDVARDGSARLIESV
jgi:ceramide glucosyltransferase